MPHDWSRFALRSLVIALAPFVGSAQPPPHKPAPPPELEQLSYLLGQWHCSGQITPPGASAPLPYEADLRASAALGGHWYQITFEQKAAGQLPPTTSIGYLGYDPARKEYVRGLVDDSGVHELATSPGWQGNTLVWNGRCNCTGSEGPFLHTFTRTSDRAFTDQYDVRVNGKWREFFSDKCTKTGGTEARRPAP